MKSFIYLALLCLAPQIIAMQSGTVACIDQKKSQEVSRDAQIKNLFDTQDGLRPDAIKILIADYLCEAIILKTPEKLPWLMGFKTWQPYYPPIKSLEFQGPHTLIAKAPGVNRGYSFILKWNLLNQACSVTYTGFRNDTQTPLCEYKREHQSFPQKKITAESDSHQAEVLTHCEGQTIYRRPIQIIYRTDHQVEVTSKVNALKAILLSNWTPSKNQQNKSE